MLFGLTLGNRVDFVYFDGLVGFLVVASSMVFQLFAHCFRYWLASVSDGFVGGFVVNGFDVVAFDVVFVLGFNCLAT